MRLPPLNALRAFEAAARHGGFIGASEELHVTRGAISRHVKLLEEHLGEELFRRHAKGVTLTDAGRRLFPVLIEAFGKIAEESARIAADAQDLRIICPPATSIRWLIPRLDEFRARHPDIRVRLTTDFHSDTGFDSVEYDVGFSATNWPRDSHIELLPLFPILMSPAAAPKLLDAKPELRKPEGLTQTTLLHETAHHRDWTDWLTDFPVPGVSPQSGDAFPNLDLSTRAGVMGAGMVMADFVLCQDELEAGTLVMPYPEMVARSGMGDICLIGSRDKWNSPKVELFKAWVSEVAQKAHPDFL